MRLVEQRENVRRQSDSTALVTNSASGRREARASSSRWLQQVFDFDRHVEGERRDA